MFRHDNLFPLSAALIIIDKQKFNIGSHTYRDLPQAPKNLITQFVAQVNDSAVIYSNFIQRYQIGKPRQISINIFLLS